jgi:hypothetical protein
MELRRQDKNCSLETAAIIDTLECCLINEENWHDEPIRRPIGPRLSIYWLFVGQNRREIRHIPPEDSKIART